MSEESKIALFDGVPLFSDFTADETKFFERTIRNFEQDPQLKKMASAVAVQMKTAFKELRVAEDLVQYEEDMQEEWEDGACIRVHIYSDMDGISPIPMWQVKDPDDDLKEFIGICNNNNPDSEWYRGE